MVLQSQPLAVQMRLSIDNDGCCSLKDLFFSPIRFSGRQWMWMNSDSEGRVSQIALKRLAFPFLVCSIILAAGMAIIGGLVLPAESIPRHTDYNPRGDISLLKKDLSDEQVEREISGRLTASGYVCSVHVRSSERSAINHDYYPDYVHRNVTLTNPSSTSASRFRKVIENHFWNKNAPSLTSLHTCLYGGVSSEDLERLKEILALHEGVTFSMAFDLAYVSTRLGGFPCD